MFFRFRSDYFCDLSVRTSGLITSIFSQIGKGGDNVRLLSLRTSAGWSQEFVARQMEVSRATRVDWGCGNAEPRMREAVKLAKLSGITVKGLLSDDQQ